MASPAALTWMRRLAWAVVSVLALWGVMWVAVPPLMRWQSQKRLSAALGRPVTIEAVEFKPWSMEVTMRGLAIGPAPGAGTSAPPLLQVARLYADGDWRSVLRFAPVIAHLEIDTPQLHVARTAPGRYDIDDIIDRIQRPAEPGTGTADRGPARFALHNLQLRDGAITFDDRPVQRRHQVTALQVSLPFLSSLPSQVEVVVQPRLSFQFGDTHVDTGAQTTPFAPDRQTSMTLRMSPLDLAPLAAYLPAVLPVRLLGGHAKADVSVHFARRADGSPALSLRGTLGADGIALADRAGAPLVQWKALHVEVADAQPLERKLELGTVRFEGLQLAVTRDAQGRLNVARLAGPAAASSPAPSPAPATAGAAWQLRLKALELADARVSWADATTRPATALALEAIEVRLGPAAWPSKELAPLKLQARLGGGPAGAAPATLHIEGDAGPQKATVAVRVDQLALAAFAPYLEDVLQPRLEGIAAVDGTLSWAAEPQALSMDVARFALDDLRVVDGSTRPGRGDAPRDPLSWKALEITGAKVDIAARTASIGRVALRQPRIAVERARDGTLNLERWLVAPAPGGAAPAPTSSSSDPPSWRVTLADASIDDGRVRWSDDAADPARTTPVALNVSALNVSATGLAWPKAAAPADLRVSAVVADPAAPRGSRRQQGGSVDWRGRVALDPLEINGALRVERFPLHALEPYAGRGFNATVQRAEGHWRGDVALRQRPNGIEATASGDALLAELHVFGLDPASAAVSPDELLSWRSLQLRGLKVAVAPSAKPRVDIGEAVVSDFYSQLVVSEDGRFNLRDVRAAPSGAAPPGGFAVGRQIAPPAPSPDAASAPASAAAPSSAASDAAQDATPLRARLPVELRVGGLQLVNGRVDYTDRFVRPNYSAALSELNGRLGAFEAGSPDMATLELTGRVAGTAQLDVRGSLNPMADPLALDVRAKTTDLELAPLSPYAGKYAGYAIERGKLSMDVHYRVQPDGRLEASNRVVLNQLTFGEHIESPSATKLPVRLAVALLKDRNGVIDVNLPVQGSINDPQFSVAGLVVRIIVNLIAKALTAPFSLLAGGGGEDLSVVTFRPGTSTMTDDAGAVIDKVAKALEERPTLQMTVTGSADPASEADAIRRNQLERRIAAQQRNEAVRTGRAASAPDAPATGDERARLLRAIYRDTELPDKPKNVLGFEKDVPAAEMEALLLKHLPANPDAARELALQRGVVVRDALVAKGLPSERLFLAAPKLGGTNEPAAPQARLSLAVK